MFLVVLVCLFVSEQLYSKSYERILMNFYGGVWGNNILNSQVVLLPLQSGGNKLLYSDGHLDRLRWGSKMN